MHQDAPPNGAGAGGAPPYKGAPPALAGPTEGENALVTVQEVVGEFNSRSAGARLNLPIYLRGDTTLEILTRSVLQGLGKEPAEWKRHAPVVEQAAADPKNHAPDCPCEECLSWEETF